MSKKYDMQSVDNLLSVLSKPKPPVVPTPPTPPVADTTPVQAQPQPGWLGNPLQAVTPSSPLSTGLREQAKQGFGETAGLFRAGYPGQATWHALGTASNLVGGAMVAPIAATFPRTMAGVGRGMEFVAQNAPSFLTTASGIPIPLSGTPQRPISQEMATMKEQYPSVYRTGGDILSTAMMVPAAKAVGALKGVKLPAVAEVEKIAQREAFLNALGGAPTAAKNPGLFVKGFEQVVAKAIRKIPIQASDKILKRFPGSTFEQQTGLQQLLTKYNFHGEAAKLNKKSMMSMRNKTIEMMQHRRRLLADPLVNKTDLSILKSYADEQLAKMAAAGTEKIKLPENRYKQINIRGVGPINTVFNTVGIGIHGIRKGIRKMTPTMINRAKNAIEKTEGGALSFRDLVERPGVQQSLAQPIPPPRPKLTFKKLGEQGSVQLPGGTPPQPSWRKKQKLSEFVEPQTGFKGKEEQTYSVNRNLTPDQVKEFKAWQKRRIGTGREETSWKPKEISSPEASELGLYTPGTTGYIIYDPDLPRIPWKEHVYGDNPIPGSKEILGEDYGHGKLKKFESTPIGTKELETNVKYNLDPKKHKTINLYEPMTDDQIHGIQYGGGELRDAVEDIIRDTEGKISGKKLYDELIDYIIRSCKTWDENGELIGWSVKDPQKEAIESVNSYISQSGFIGFNNEDAIFAITKLPEVKVTKILRQPRKILAGKVLPTDVEHKLPLTLSSLGATKRKISFVPKTLAVKKNLSDLGRLNKKLGESGSVQLPGGTRSLADIGNDIAALKEKAQKQWSVIRNIRKETQKSAQPNWELYQSSLASQRILDKETVNSIKALKNEREAILKREGSERAGKYVPNQINKGKPSSFFLDESKDMTIDNVKKSLSNKGIETNFDLENIDPRVAREIHASISHNISDFGEIVNEKLAAIKVEPTSRGIMEFDRKNNIIRIDSDYAKSYDKFVERMSEGKTAVEGLHASSIKEMFDHELGHSLSREIKGHTGIKTRMSSYSRRNPRERIAELFSAGRRGELTGTDLDDYNKLLNIINKGR